MRIDKLVPYRNKPLIGFFVQKIISIYGIDIPNSVKIGRNVHFPHNSVGTVIHDNTVIEDDVKIYQNVTIGRGDIWNDVNIEFNGFIIRKGAILCAGAKIINSSGTLIVGENTVIGANAVLTKSTGDNEIWAGIPARKIGNR